MKTLEQITPEQQIKNQSETISRLRQQIESMEKELQKYLDPDRTIHPELKPGKQGETGLLEQINTLQKQLDDCLENEPKWVRDNLFEDVICNTIAAQFMPVEKHNTYRKECFTEGPGKLWFQFRSAIFEGPACASLLQSQAFRDVLWVMNNFIDDLSRPSTTFHLLTGSAEVILENTTAEGWALLLEALSLSQDNGVFAGDADEQWLRLTILNIHRCVKMYHEAIKAEKGN